MHDDYSDDYESPTEGRGISLAALIAIAVIIAMVAYACFLAVAKAEPDDRYEFQIRAPGSPHVSTRGRAMTAAGHITSFATNQADFAVIGGRPPDCPRRYCGCVLSLDYFGRVIPHLLVAANWLGFPRAHPAPGMAAARKGHVMKLLAHVRGKEWRVLDPNSGNGLTRIHVRSIAGFVIVNPHARKV